MIATSLSCFDHICCFCARRGGLGSWGGSGGSLGGRQVVCVFFVGLGRLWCHSRHCCHFSRDGSCTTIALCTTAIDSARVLGQGSRMAHSECVWVERNEVDAAHAICARARLLLLRTTSRMCIAAVPSCARWNSNRNLMR